MYFTFYKLQKMLIETLARCFFPRSSCLSGEHSPSFHNNNTVTGLMGSVPNISLKKRWADVSGRKYSVLLKHSKQCQHLLRSSADNRGYKYLVLVYTDVELCTFSACVCVQSTQSHHILRFGDSPFTGN